MIEILFWLIPNQHVIRPATGDTIHPCFMVGRRHEVNVVLWVDDFLILRAFAWAWFWRESPSQGYGSPAPVKVVRTRTKRSAPDFLLRLHR